MLTINKARKAAVIQSLLLFLCLNIVVTVQAEKDSKFAFKLSPSIDYIFYRELSDSNETLNTETGFLPGFSFSLSHNISDDFRIFSLGYYGSSIIDYDGKLQNGQVYNTNSNMVRSHYRLGVYYSYPKSGVGVFIGRNEWDRHILSRGDVPTLSEYYYWNNLGVNFFHVVNNSKIEIELARLFNAGLNVDLTVQGYGVISVLMPNGLSASVSIENEIGLDWPGWMLGVKLKSNYFPRGEATNAQGIGLTEPENFSMQLSLYLSRNFRF